MSVSLCQVARVGHFQQDFATKTFTKLISAQKVISGRSLVGIITTKIMAPMAVKTFLLDLLFFFAPLPKSLTNKCFWILPTGRKDWAHLIIELNHCVLRDRRSRWGNEKDSWLSCEQKYHRFTFLNFFTFLFWSLTFPQELQSADLFVMITMIIIGCWLLTMMMKHKRKSLPPNLLLHNWVVGGRWVRSNTVFSRALVHLALLLWCAGLWYSGVPDGSQGLAAPISSLPLHYTPLDVKPHQCTNVQIQIQI